MAATPTPAAQALLDALAARPGATATELANTAGIGRSTAAKLLATLAANGQVLCQPGGLQDGRRTANRWTLSPPVPIPDSSPATPAAPPATEAGRLGAGQLRQLVLSCLTERPGQALSPTAIAKALDRSAGAVANALRVLADQGAVVQTQPRPRRYTIATAGDDSDTRRQLRQPMP